MLESYFHFKPVPYPLSGIISFERVPELPKLLFLAGFSPKTYSVPSFSLKESFHSHFVLLSIHLSSRSFVDKDSKPPVSS